MKAILGISFLFTLTTATAQAEEIWFALEPTNFPVPPSAFHYPSADAACRVAYARDVEEFTSDVSSVLPYVGVVFNPSTNAPYLYNCDTQTSIGNTVYRIPHLIASIGDECVDGRVFDFVVGKCASNGEQQDRRQRGDPNNDPNNDPSDCQGNPINVAIGNKFESNTDYVDADGELRFARFYNSDERRWRHSYGASLTIGMSSVALTFEDGRSSLFQLAGSVATGEPTERGLLVKSGNLWIYSSPANETLTFNGQGKLTSLKLASGQTQLLSYGFDPNFNNQVTVKDSRGHVLTFAEDFSGHLVGVTAPGFTAAYEYNSGGMLALVTRTMQGKSASRSYLYEDMNNPAFLTGLVDERGLRVATWAYDSQGRAISSEHSGGVGKTTITYADDGTTTVTNALGHAVTYKYMVIAGTKRMVTVTGAPAPGCPISNSSFTYDGRGQIATQTDARGQVTAFTYDAQGRITTKTEAKGAAEERVTTTTWDGASFRPKTVSTTDRVVTYAYDTQGRLHSTHAKSVKEN